MSRIAIGLAVVLMLFSVSANAQEYPAAEVFGGFAFLDGDTHMYGWQASGAANMTEKLGLVADFGGQYDSVSGVDLSTYQFLAGPRLRTGHSGWVGFGHSLFGLQRASASGFGSDNAFGMGLGGGVDFMTDRGIGIRLIQLDWLPARSSGSWATDHYRAGVGVVIPIHR